MCVPILVGLAIASLATAAAGAGVAAYSAHKQGEYAQDVANYNAKVDDQQAKHVEDLGNVQEQQQMQRTRQILAAQRAGMSGTGVLADSGSFANIEDSTNFMGAADAMTIRANAAKEAWGYRTGADIARLQGSLAATSGNYQMVGSILSGAGQTFGMLGQDAKTFGWTK